MSKIFTPSARLFFTKEEKEWNEEEQNKALKTVFNWLKWKQMFKMDPFKNHFLIIPTNFNQFVQIFKFKSDTLFNGKQQIRLICWHEWDFYSTLTKLKNYDIHAKISLDPITQLINLNLICYWLQLTVKPIHRPYDFKFFEICSPMFFWNQYMEDWTVCERRHHWWCQTY